jgi:2-oxoglutarate ferredoxin oxidoreductase subunit alpha
MAAAYASHGDTKHPLLFPATPKECFDFAALALDLADKLQTPIIVLSDLELGMNDNLSDPFEWDDTRRYDRGKVLSAADLDRLEVFGRYLDIDGDGVGYRTLPGTHPDKGAFFTRGTSRDEFAAYTESPEVYQRNMERLLKKWRTASTLVPTAEIAEGRSSIGVLYYGTTALPIPEALDLLAEEGIVLDTCRVRGFPFGAEVEAFVNAHEHVFIVEQNRDAQMRTLLINECEFAPQKLIAVNYYAGLSISADFIQREVSAYYQANKLPRLTGVRS